jgi:hypothetical protein
MNGRMTKEVRAMELARFAICDFQEQVGAVIKASAKLRDSGLAEPHHIALDAWLAATDNALDDWHEAERVSVAEFNKKAVQS